MSRRPLHPSWTLLVAALLLALGAGLVAVRQPAPAGAQAPQVASEADLAPAAGAPAPLAVTPSASPSPSVPPPLPSGRATLSRTLADRLAQSPVGSSVGVAVVDEHGRPVAGHRADIAHLPASTMKLLTAAAALERFGPDHRFTTTVTGELTGGGTVVGDLRVVGGGDPLLATADYQQWIYPARPRTSLEELADAVVAAGVRRVIGSVVGLDGWAREPLARGWTASYLDDLDARRITALTVDAGLDWRVVTEQPAVELELHSSNDPPATAARAFTRLLVERGVTVEHGGRSSVEGPAELVPVPTIAEVTSPPLVDLLRHTVERSDNHVADSVFRALGAADGDATWSGGGRAVVAALGRLGVTTDGLALADGSGLSRLDRIPPSVLAELDRAMTMGRHAGHWADLMAVTGVEGTLEGRLVGTVAEGRVFGKTGTLDDVVALAGSVSGHDGRRYHFAVVANLPAAASRWDARIVTDELVLLLAQDLWCGGVVLVPSPGPSGDDDDRATVPAAVCDP